MIRTLGKEATINNILEIIEKELNKISAEQRLNSQEFEHYLNTIKEKESMDYSILQTLIDWLEDISKCNGQKISENENI